MLQCKRYLEACILELVTSDHRIIETFTIMLQCSNIPMIHERMLVKFYNFINNLKASPARKSKLILIPSIIALAFNLLIWALIYFKFRPLVYNLPEADSFIPLHYNIYMGIDSFGIWQKIFILPGFGLVAWAINTFLAIIIYNKKEIISYFLSFASIILQIFLLTATILIILINI